MLKAEEQNICQKLTPKTTYILNLKVESVEIIDVSECKNASEG